MSKKIGLICGHVSKAAPLYEQLAKHGFNVLAVDIRGNKLKSRFKVLKCMRECGAVFVIADDRHFPLLYKGKKYFKCKVFNFLEGNTAVNGKTLKYLQSFDANIAEFSYIARTLENAGVTNCDVQPPFKDVNSRNAQLELSDGGKNRICVLGDIGDAAERYNSCHDDKIAVSSEIDGDSLALILPDTCNAQAIISAYSKGLPVIAGNIGGNNEIIRNFETGWVYPNKKVNNLYDSIEYIMAHKREMTDMRRNCALLTTRYTPNYVVPRIIEKYLK